jgi:hypothetical protein
MCSCLENPLHPARVNSYYLFQILFNFCNILVSVEDSILIQTNRRDKCINETITIKNITNNANIIKLKDAYKASAYGITSLVSVVIISIVLFFVIILLSVSIKYALKKQMFLYKK